MRYYKCVLRGTNAMSVLLCVCVRGGRREREKKRQKKERICSGVCMYRSVLERRRTLQTSGHIPQETLSLPSRPPAPGDSCLRFSDAPRTDPGSAPRSHVLPKAGAKDRATCLPLPRGPHPHLHSAGFSMLVDLCFYFRDRRVSSLSVSNS